MGLQQMIHFLEEVPVCDDLEFLEDEEDAAADEEGLVFDQSLVQQQQVSFAHGLCDISELHEVILSQQLIGGHVTQQHLDRQQIDENESLVSLTGAMTVCEGEAQIFFSWFEVTVKHCFPAHIILVRDSLCLAVVVLQV